MDECRIADMLMSLRAAKGVTQEAVAQSLSVSNRTVSKWENGISEPNLAMLIKLAQYYGTTTDTLLGMTVECRQGTTGAIHAAFRGLDQRETVLTAFDTVRSVIPATFDAFSHGSSVDEGTEPPLPETNTAGYRYQISNPDFYDFVASWDDVNVAVMLLPNKENFAWMKDPCKQKRIVKLLHFLADENTLSVMYFLHSTACSESFTADYVARHTGLEEAFVSEVLDELCSLEACGRVTARLTEGEVNVYVCQGDGIILSLISLAYEHMCGSPCYGYNYRGTCKMIRGDGYELV